MTAHPRSLSVSLSILLGVTSLAVSGFYAPFVANGQDSTGNFDGPPVYGGVNFRVRGVFVTPVAGEPFSATVLIESKRPLPNGTMETKQTMNAIARDTAGRIHNERRQLEAESFHGTPPLLETHIFDPQTRLNTFYDPFTRVAKQSVLGVPASNLLAVRKNPQNPNVKEEDLGTTTLNGMSAKGTRTTRTVNAQLSGTGQPVEVVDEYWYSDELKLNLLVHHVDPRTGEQSVAISDLRRGEPAAALFEVPAGYKTVDVTPPSKN